jgi:hypothetical protein
MINTNKILANVKRNNFTFTKSEAKIVLDYEDDRDLLYKWLHDRGTWRSLLSDNEVLTFRTFGDGSGKNVNTYDWIMCWDHIKDSSELAIKKISDAIREWVDIRTI